MKNDLATETCHRLHRRAILRTGHVANAANIQKQTVLSYWHGLIDTKNQESPRRLQESIGQMYNLNSADEDAERNNHCRKRQGHLEICQSFFIEMIA